MTMPDPDPITRLLGQEMLKQKYWKNLGVEYHPGYEHMDDTQTYYDRAKGVNERGNPDILALQHYQDDMEKNLKLPTLPSINRSPQPISYHPMAAALQGQQDPTMQALFSQPAPHLQQMAGDVIEPNPHAFGPNVFTDDWWNRVSQPGGYDNPATAAPVAQGHMSGKIRVLNPAGK